MTTSDDDSRPASADRQAGATEYVLANLDEQIDWQETHPKAGARVGFLRDIRTRAMQASISYSNALAAEQAASCRLREALEKLIPWVRMISRMEHGQVFRWNPNPQEDCKRDLAAAQSIIDAPAPCVHQQRAEAARRWLIHHGQHPRPCPHYEAAWGQERKPCNCGLADLLDPAALADAGAGDGGAR